MHIVTECAVFGCFQALRDKFDFALAQAIFPSFRLKKSEFQGHHTNQACYKSGIMSPEYPKEVFYCTKGRNVWCTESPLHIPD